MNAARTTVALIASLALSAAAAPPERTMPVDPVALLTGDERPGDPDLAVEHEGYVYLFSTEQNRDAFARDPARYRAADGGACGRMGALSGLGDARRHAVHEGRIYFFASDGCLEEFLKNPDACIERPDDRPEPDAADQARGREILSRLLGWAGGADRLAEVRAYRRTTTRTTESNGEQWTHAETVEAVLPRAFSKSDTWTSADRERRWAMRVVEGRAVSESPDGCAQLASERTAAFARGMRRWPIALLASHADPAVVVWAGDPDSVGGIECESVNMHTGGVTVRMLVEPGTGRLVAVRHQGRGPGAIVGEIERRFTGYRAVNGVTVPIESDVYFNGEPRPKTGDAEVEFELNPAIETAAWLCDRRP